MTKRLPIIEAERSGKGAPTLTVKDGGKARSFEVTISEMQRNRDRLNRDQLPVGSNGSEQ